MTGSGRMRRACACEVIAANALGQLTWISNVDELQRETQGNGGSRGFPAESAGLGIRRVHEDRHVGQVRHGLPEELQPFPTELDVAGGEAGDIAAWTGEPRHQPHADGVGHAAEDDWHTAGLSQSLSERVHIRPVFGDMLAGKVDAETLERFYAQLRRCRDRCDGRIPALSIARESALATVMSIVDR